MLAIKKILFPCDLEKNSSKILPYVLSVSKKYNSMICLLHVVQNPPLWFVCDIPFPSSVMTLQREVLQCAEKAMDIIFMNILCDEQLERCPNFQRMIVYGDPTTEILKTIMSEDIDLVIMGTHGRKGLLHTILGSVAEKVVKKSPVPVLIINTCELK